MAKKFRYRVCLSAEENRSGFVKLTRKEAQIVAYATNPQNWENDSGCAYSGSFDIDVKTPSKCCDKKEADNDILFFSDDTIIVTENTDGEVYLIRARYIQDVIDDWEDECNFVPANDAKVFFASWNNQPINPHLYTDFESLLKYLQGLTR